MTLPHLAATPPRLATGVGKRYRAGGPARLRGSLLRASLIPSDSRNHERVTQDHG